MPIPGSPNAPYFKGKRASDFLDSLEQHADQANIGHHPLSQAALQTRTKAELVAFLKSLTDPTARVTAPKLP